MPPRELYKSFYFECWWRHGICSVSYSFINLQELTGTLLIEGLSASGISSYSIELSLYCGCHSTCARWSKLIGWFAMYLSIFFSKPFVLSASTTQFGSLFHMSTTRFVKKYFRTFNVARFLFSLNLFPLETLGFISRSPSATSLSYLPVTSLNTSIKSPLTLLYDKVGILSLCNLSWYVSPLIFGSSLVARLWTFSIPSTSMCFLRNGHQIWLAYSICGLTS